MVRAGMTARTPEQVVNPEMGAPQNRWFKRENPTKMDDLGRNHHIGKLGFCLFIFLLEIIMMKTAIFSADDEPYQKDQFWFSL